MKKIIILGILLTVFGFNYSSVSADVIPLGSHYFNRCSKVVNLDKYPEISLIGYSPVSFTSEYKSYQIKNNECLTSSSRYEFSIYWNSKGNISIIENNLISNSIQIGGSTVSDKDPLIKEEVEYSVIKLPSGKYDLQKTKVTSEFNNGTAAKIESFPIAGEIKKVETPKIEPKKVETKVVETPVVNKVTTDIEKVNVTPNNVVPVKKGFWHRLICFFGLSKNC